VQVEKRERKWKPRGGEMETERAGWAGSLASVRRDGPGPLALALAGRRCSAPRSELLAAQHTLQKVPPVRTFLQRATDPPLGGVGRHPAGEESGSMYSYGYIATGSSDAASRTSPPCSMLDAAWAPPVGAKTLSRACSEPVADKNGGRGKAYCLSGRLGSWLGKFHLDAT
jgi:hypothetical protein